MTHPKQFEREASTLRICCELIAQHGAMTVVDVCALSNLREAGIRHALKRGIDTGYLVEGTKKQMSVAKGNARKTYVRTKKRLPGVTEAAPEPVIVRSEFAPFRHWQDTALFGPASRIWSNTGHVEARVYTQSMSVTDDELEAVCQTA